MDDKWNPVQGEELTGFLDQINPVGDKYHVNSSTTLVEWRPLPFYDQVALIRVKDPAWSPRNLFIYYLTDQGNLFWLNGTSPPIHEVNSKAPIKVTDDNVLEYLKFFCFFVRGEDGPFLVAEDMNDTYVPKELDNKTRTVIEGTVRPATFEGEDGEGNRLCEAVVYYSNALFIANFSVQPGGMIEMLSDEPIAADLPIKIDAPVS